MKLGGSLRRSRGGRERLSRVGELAEASRRYLVAQFGHPRFLAGVGLLAVLGFGGGFLISTNVLFPAPPPPGDLSRVPDLSGRTMADASGLLLELGLSVQSVDSLRHPFLPEGSIVGQSPLPGQLALVGDTLRVALSQGPETRAVPNVVRLRADRAEMVLEATGFQVTVDSVESGRPRGTVVAMTPDAGTEATVPHGILLTVSRGPPMVEMPLLLGLRQEEAILVLDSLGLNATDIQTRFRFGRDQGLVVEQEPAATTLVERGGAVRLVVGRRGG